MKTYTDFCNAIHCTFREVSLDFLVFNNKYNCLHNRKYYSCMFLNQDGIINPGNYRKSLIILLAAKLKYVK